MVNTWVSKIRRTVSPCFGMILAFPNCLTMECLVKGSGRLNITDIITNYLFANMKKYKNERKNKRGKDLALFPLEANYSIIVYVFVVINHIIYLQLRNIFFFSA